MYNFTKDNHFSLRKQGFDIKTESFTTDGDVAVIYSNAAGEEKMLYRADDATYAGIVNTWYNA